MDREEYSAVQQQLVLLAHIVWDMPLGIFLSKITLADSLGPILDPTLYRQAMGSLDKIGRLASALLPFQEVAREMLVDGDEEGIGE